MAISQARHCAAKPCLCYDFTSGLPKQLLDCRCIGRRRQSLETIDGHGCEPETGDSLA